MPPQVATFRLVARPGSRWELLRPQRTGRNLTRRPSHRADIVAAINWITKTSPLRVACLAGPIAVRLRSRRGPTLRELRPEVGPTPRAGSFVQNRRRSGRRRFAEEMQFPVEIC